jgi:CRP/FNR family cyclic AMP-dependent transcriptional regulator
VEARVPKKRIPGFFRNPTNKPCALESTVRRTPLLTRRDTSEALPASASSARELVFVRPSDAPIVRQRDPSSPGTADGNPVHVPVLTDHAHCAILAALFRGTLCEQLATGPVRRVIAGQFLYYIGGLARSVFLVRRGLVKTSVVSPGGQELTLHVYQSGDVLGELCLCGGARTEQAIALADSDVVEIPVEAFVARLRNDGAAALEFAMTACERLADAHERLRSLAADPVLGRLIRTLLRLAIEMGENTPRGLRLAHHLDQEELAQLVGARREVVSTLLNRLRERGLLSYSRGGQIHIDRDRLQKLAAWLDADTD